MSRSSYVRDAGSGRVGACCRLRGVAGRCCRLPSAARRIRGACPPFMSYANPRSVGRPGHGQYGHRGPGSGPDVPPHARAGTSGQGSRHPRGGPARSLPARATGASVCHGRSPVAGRRSRGRCWPPGRSRATSPSPSFSPCRGSTCNGGASQYRPHEPVEANRRPGHVTGRPQSTARPLTLARPDC